MTIQKNSDLHMHSTASDGGYSPSELMKKCKEEKLRIVALTDHDTVSGIEIAAEAAARLGLHFIPGIELSTVHKGRSIHILGYGIDWKNPALLEMLHNQKNLRIERIIKMIKKLQAEKVNITEEQVFSFSDGGSMGRPHVARALVEEGYVKSVGEAFDRYLAEGRSAYVEKSKELSVKEAIDWIHHADGIAVVAHPVYYHMDKEIIDWVNHLHLDGIEVYHRDHDQAAQVHYENMCQELDQTRKSPLFRTGGSDFHHEDYGRIIQPLGITRIQDHLARRIMDKE